MFGAVVKKTASPLLPTDIQVSLTTKEIISQYIHGWIHLAQRVLKCCTAFGQN